jgi:hypothetical protein
VRQPYTLGNHDLKVDKEIILANLQVWGKEGCSEMKCKSNDDSID